MRLEAPGGCNTDRGVAVVFEYSVADSVIITSLMKLESAIVFSSVRESGEPDSLVARHGQRHRLCAGQQPAVLCGDVNGRLFPSVAGLDVSPPTGRPVDSLVTPVPFISGVRAVHCCCRCCWLQQHSRQQNCFRRNLPASTYPIKLLKRLAVKAIMATGMI